VRTRESNLGSFVADIIRSETGADVVLYNGGTLRSDSTYGPGELTLKHLVSILPFPDPIVVIEVTGEQLKAALGTRQHTTHDQQQLGAYMSFFAVFSVAENSVSKVPVQEGRFAQISGMRYVYTRSQPAGQRVLHVRHPRPPRGPKP